jgi:hypothetical protein
VIQIYAGLSVLLHEVVKVVLTRAELTSGTYPGTPSIVPTATWTEAADYMRLLLTYVRDRKMPKLPTGLLPGRDDRLFAHGMLSIYASMFTVGHEFAHILFGHLECGCRPQSSEDELAADRAGLRMLLGYLKATTSDEAALREGTMIAPCACELELLCFDAVRAARGSDDMVHPTAATRIDQLRRTSGLDQSYYDQADRLTAFCKRLLEEAFARL